MIPMSTGDLIECPNYRGILIHGSGKIYSIRSGALEEVKSWKRSRDGYIHVRLSSGPAAAHRVLADGIFNGLSSWHEVDHQNGIRSDNRQGNLRLVSKQENLMKRGNPGPNTLF